MKRKSVRGGKGQDSKDREFEDLLAAMFGLGGCGLQALEEAEVGDYLSKLD